MTSPLERWDPAGAVFDKALAVNLRHVADPDHPGHAVIRRALAPEGRFALVFQPPSRAGVETLLERMTRALEANGFAIVRAEVGDIAPVPAAGVLARPA